MMPMPVSLPLFPSAKLMGNHGCLGPTFVIAVCNHLVPFPFSASPVFAMKKDREWATWAVSCYMNAIAYGEARARLMITRVIWLLSYDAEASRYSSKVIGSDEWNRSGRL
jgi:hypothetical protein